MILIRTKLTNCPYSWDEFKIPEKNVHVKIREEQKAQIRQNDINKDKTDQFSKYFGTNLNFLK
jgi:hypothetical protein